MTPYAAILQALRQGCTGKTRALAQAQAILGGVGPVGPDGQHRVGMGPTAARGPHYPRRQAVCRAERGDGMTTNDDSIKWVVGRLQALQQEHEEARRADRVVDHAACRIASETCLQELLRAYDRLDEARAEVERLQAEVTRLQAAAYRAGQEAMRERCAALCDDWEEATYCDGWREMEQGAQHCAEAIRALVVEP